MQYIHPHNQRTLGSTLARPHHRRARAASKPRLRPAYTLVEVLTVLVILGLLVTLAMVGLQWAVRSAERTAFAENLRQYANAAQMYRLKTGAWPRTPAAPGQLPPGLEEWIDPGDWNDQTPLGGNWSYEFGGSGFTAGIGVSFQTDGDDDNADVKRMRWASRVQNIDNELDDGNPDTGNMRLVDDSTYYMILK